MTTRPVVGQVRAGVLLARPGSAVRHNVDLVIAGDRIEAVNPAAAEGLSDPRTAGVSLVMPALADAHDHGRGLPTMAYGAADQALETWLPALSQHPSIDPSLLTSLALAKLARSGVGSVVHCHNVQRADALVEEGVSAARAALQIGVRMALAVPLADRHRLGYGPDDAVLACVDPVQRAAVVARWGATARPIAEQLEQVDAVARAIAELGPDAGLVPVQYCPVGPQWCSDELLEAVAEASVVTGRRVHTHLFETRYQREWADATFAGGLVRHLDAIGLLSDRLTVAHGVWLDENDAEILADRGVTVSINTSSNLRLRSGRAAVTTLLRAGVKVAFGMDGMSLDDDEDALRELQLSMLLHAGIGLDAELDAATVLGASMTNGPATVSGPDSWGVIAPGAPADFVVLDRSRLITDIANPGAIDESTLVLTRARAQHVTDLVVAGRWVVRDRVVIGVDEAAIAAEVAAQCRAAGPSIAALAPAVEAFQAGLRAFYTEGHHRSVRPIDPGTRLIHAR